MSSPTQRSKALIEKSGFMTAITERWNQFARIRQDLFGFIDLLAIRGDLTIAIQTTTASNAAARIQKIRGLQSAKLWLDSPNRLIVVHGWSKKGPRGKRKTWQCNEIPITKL